MFEAQTRQEIAARMKEKIRTDGNVSCAEGTFTSDLIQANALEFSKAYAELNLAVQAGFADTSWGEYLTMIAEQFGVLRKRATKATGILKITGTAGAQVIKNSLFATSADVRFYTKENCVIGAGGTAYAGIEAESAGNMGNVEAGTITEIPMSIYGVLSVVNEAETNDGFDEETDNQLLQRYLLKVRTPATSGNRHHYLLWALEVEGVGNAFVVPLWTGNGTVKVVIIDANGATASEGLIEKTYTHIESVRPIGATVTVTTAKAKRINIDVDVVGEMDKAEFEEKVADYLKSINFENRRVSIAKVGKILLETTGVVDYENLRLNDHLENIIIEIEEIPVIGEVKTNVIPSAS